MSEGFLKANSDQRAEARQMPEMWWCVQSGRQDGPMSLDALKDKLRDVDTREVFVWRDGFEDWKRVEDVPEVMPPRPKPPPPFRAEAGKQKPIPSNTPSVKARLAGGAVAALVFILAAIGWSFLKPFGPFPQWSTNVNFVIGFVIGFAYWICSLALAVAAYHGTKQYVERKRSEADGPPPEGDALLGSSRITSMKQRKIAISLAVVAAIAAPFALGTYAKPHDPKTETWVPFSKEEQERIRLVLAETNNCQTDLDRVYQIIGLSYSPEMPSPLEVCRNYIKARQKGGTLRYGIPLSEYLAVNAAAAAAGFIAIFALSILALRYWRWLKT
jgi:hypothetical protein